MIAAKLQKLCIVEEVVIQLSKTFQCNGALKVEEQKQARRMTSKLKTILQIYEVQNIISRQLQFSASTLYSSKFTFSCYWSKTPRISQITAFNTASPVLGNWTICHLQLLFLTDFAAIYTISQQCISSNPDVHIITHHYLANNDESTAIFFCFLVFGPNLNW